ncbi:phosphoribosyltransferase [Saccharothrix australiensis]|uniref:Putative amidophosphoribosyltransferase n=1 Tax=Saccharothrix australiensis TaxID=2072 RepID=A0A495W719_9PSEU|nr:phosphoribosyltransferase [Saccharothrix australiensis]RKT57462.1 putative amidophosphoribosyltransferase [Saccharothrix australiensis]
MLINLLFPPRCAGCRAEGTSCCARCLSSFGPPRRVRVPGKGPPLFALADYAGAARELVLAFKERGRRDLARVFGALLAAAVPALPVAYPGGAGNAWLVPAPSRRAAARRRGGSHLVGAARAAGLAVAPALAFGPGVGESVGLDAAARRANLAGRVRLVRCGLPPPGSPVVVLDDVVTTGATTSACVSALKAGGYGVTAVLTLTTAYRAHPDG